MLLVVLIKSDSKLEQFLNISVDTQESMNASLRIFDIHVKSEQSRSSGERYKKIITFIGLHSKTLQKNQVRSKTNA